MDRTEVPTVLVVEDDLVNLRLLSEICRAEGYQALEASDGVAALALFDDHAVDILLIDAAMPQMDGYTLCRAIRERSDVPIIMVSASTDSDVQDRAFAAGATGFVSKPFRVFELVRRMRVALQRLRSPSEPPTESQRALRKQHAGVLERVGSALQLRRSIRMASRVSDVVCLLVELESEAEILAEAGRNARDAAMGCLAGALLDLRCELFWSESNELVCLAALEDEGRLAEALEGATRRCQRAGIARMQIRHGGMRVRRSADQDPEAVLLGLRRLVEIAREAGEAGRIEGESRGD